MTIKVINVLRRKPGMTHEEFRHAYETGHSRIALKLFGHLWTGYRRFYFNNATSFLGATAIPGYGEGSADCPIDAISEVTYPDMAALRENERIANIPENKKLLTEDELRTFDRPNCWVTVVEMVEDDPAVEHAALNRLA